VNTDRENTVCIVVNGQPGKVPVASLPAQLESLGYDLRFAAVAVNETVVPRHTLSDRVLHEGDRVEIVNPMQGG
jgi:thiamine biosynthesis protein ThiS